MGKSPTEVAPAERPRPWVKLHLSMFRSDRMLDRSPTALAFWFFALGRAADERRDGLISITHRNLLRWAPELDDYPTALDELADAGLIRIVDDETAEVLRWVEFQGTEEQVQKRRRSDATRQQRKAIVEKEKAPSQPSEPGKLTATSLKAMIYETCEAADGTVLGYRGVLAIAADVAAENPVSPKTGSALANVVIEHAYRRWCDEDVAYGDLARLFKGASQLGEAGPAHVVWAICQTATNAVTGDRIKYVISTAQRHAAEMAA